MWMGQDELGTQGALTFPSSYHPLWYPFPLPVPPSPWPPVLPSSHLLTYVFSKDTEAIGHIPELTPGKIAG